MSWLRRSFIAGVLVTVPLAVSIAALIWVFGVVDGILGPVLERWIAVRVPGLGLITTLAAIVAVGALATNVIGKRIVQRGEQWLLRIPVFRSVYAPVRQLVAAFSPDNEFGFKRVALVELASGGVALGFLTREFTVDRGRGPEAMSAVYVPTNHLYLGDIVVCPSGTVRFPDLTIQQGIRIFLTGGMSLPGHVRARRVDGRLDDSGEVRAS
ncbi:MAG: DUF502 domain-containing protein [Vicinamibacterales bacterium]